MLCVVGDTSSLSAERALLLIASCKTNANSGVLVKHDVVAGHLCTLESFQNTYWKPFIVTEEERHEACSLTFEHEQPAASGGDSLSGF